MDKVTNLFEETLRQRGIDFELDGESERHKLVVDGTTILVSLENLKRDYAMDQDANRISGFVDTVLAAMTGKLPSWDKAQNQIYFYFEPNDFEAPSPFRIKISELLDKVPILLDESSGGVRWILPHMLEDWGITQDQLEVAAQENLVRKLSEARWEHLSFEFGRLSYIETSLPFKTALLLAPNLKEAIQPEVGWPICAIVPDSDFLFVWPAENEVMLQHVGRPALKEFGRAPHPLTTEVLRIDDDGIAAIGKF